MTPRLRTALLRTVCLFMLPTMACSANPFRRTSEPAQPVTPVATAADAPAAGAGMAASTPAAHTVAATPLRFTQGLADDVISFNPVLAADAASQAVQGLLLPRLIERDAQTGAPASTGIATGWAWSPDGATLTVTLRSGVLWSDGAPVTARDVGFTFAAVAAPTVQSPLRALVDNLSAMTPIGEELLVFRLYQADCTFLQTLTLPILPSHLFASDLSDIATHTWNDAPTVGAGPFLFVARTPGEQITLARNPSYFKGAPVIDELALRVIADPAERLRSLLAGAIDFADGLPGEAGALAGGVRMTTLLRDGFSMLAMNMADPAAPQAGRSESGALQPQAPHPILGDLRVRQAIANGIPVAQLLRDTYGADAAPLASWVLPTIPWAIASDLPAPAFDPAAARALLDAAGWLVPEGSRIRMRNAEPLALTLATNRDNPLRIRLAEGMREALNALGFDVTVQQLTFAEASAIIMQQRYDMALLGWEQLGPDPASGPYFDSRKDQPGAGVNVTSYQNAIVDTLFDAARTAPACDLQARGDLYRKIQRQVQGEAALLPLNGILNHMGVAASWKNVAPGPWGLYEGIETWAR